MERVTDQVQQGGLERKPPEPRRPLTYGQGVVAIMQVWVDQQPAWVPGRKLVGFLFGLLLGWAAVLEDRALARMELASDVDGLLRKIAAPSSVQFWERAIDSIVRVGSVAIPKLLLSLKDETVPVKPKNAFGGVPLGWTSDDLRAGAARALGRMRAAEATTYLRQVLESDKNQSVRVFASEALSQLGEPS